MIVFSTADEIFEWKRTLLAGPSSVRTTRAASTWPRPLFVRFRPGVPELADRDLPFTVVESVDDLLSVLAAVGGASSEAVVSARTQEPIDLVVETLVIDAVHHLEALLGDDARNMAGLLGAISELPVRVVLLCRFTHKDGRQFPRTCLNGSLLDYVDVAMAVEDDHLQAHPDDRLPWVMDRSGLLPARVALTGSDDFRRLERAIDYGQLTRALAAPTQAPAGAPTAAPVASSPPPPVAPPVAPPPPAPTPPVAVASPPPATAEVAAPSPAGAPAVAAVATVEAAPAAPPGPVAIEAEEGAASVALPMCTSQGRLGNDDCLGQVESAYSRDVSMIRFRKPMCGPCNDAEYEAMPKKIAASRPAPGAAPNGTVPGRQPRDEDVAVVPHGEVIGQVAPPSDHDLRAFLSSPSS